MFSNTEGEVFLLGAIIRALHVITTNLVLVSPAAGEPGKMPFLARGATGPPACGVRRASAAAPVGPSRSRPVELLLTDEHRLDAVAAAHTRRYVAEQLGMRSRPTDRHLVVYASSTKLVTSGLYLSPWDAFQRHGRRGDRRLRHPAPGTRERVVRLRHGLSIARAR